MYLNLAQIALRAEIDNARWWHDLKTGEPIERNSAALIALMHSELDEAYRSMGSDLADEHVPQHTNFCVEVADYIVRVADFLAHKDPKDAPLKDRTVDPISTKDVMALHEKYALIHLYAETHNKTSLALEALRVDDLVTAREYLRRGVAYACAMVCDLCDIVDVINDKMDYNLTRADHSTSERKKLGGKKF